MMRICGAGVPGGENSASGSSPSSRQRSGQSSVGQGGKSNPHPNSGSEHGFGEGRW